MLHICLLLERSSTPLNLAHNVLALEVGFETPTTVERPLQAPIFSNASCHSPS